MKHKSKNLEVNVNDSINVSESGDMETKSERYVVKHSLLFFHIILTTVISFIGSFFLGAFAVFGCFIISILMIFYLPGYKEKIVTIEKGKF